MKQPKETVFTCFTVVSLTGPVAGVIIGGIVSSKTGGYNNPKTSYLAAFIAVVAVSCAIPCAFVPIDYFYAQIALLWMLLFAGGFMMPILMGVMMNTVDETLKTSCIAIGQFSFNMLGFLPAPYIYGFIADMGPIVGGNKTQAMGLSLCLSIVCASFVVYHAFTVRWKNFE